MPSSELSLRIKGKEYRGWEQISVTKALSQICGSFLISGTDIFPGDPIKWDIAMGDSCEIVINDQVIITGYVENVPISYTATSHFIQIAGRDLTNDLIDCSFVEDVNEWKNLTVAAIIQELCNPFDIEVFVEDSVVSDASTIVEQFKADEGATVYDSILKLAKIKAMLPINYGDGRLTLSRSGITNTHDILELGNNVLEGYLNQSNEDRFSKYIVKGQNVGGDLLSLLSDITEPFAEAEDKIITRYRPLVVLLEDIADVGKCQARANWEARNRAGRSRSVTYTVQGWTQSNGDVWPLNALVPVKDSFLNINASLLISDLTFSMSEEGEITTMTLVDPTTYELLAESISTVATGFDFRALLENLTATS